jgi:hypothetical protein
VSGRTALESADEVAGVGELPEPGEFRDTGAGDRSGEGEVGLFQALVADVGGDELVGRGERPVQGADRDVQLAGQHPG